jgi:hypothetical protein
MTVTHQAVAAVIGLEIGVLGQERGDFGLDGLGERLRAPSRRTSVSGSLNDPG